jgi:hypothetical protein
MLGGSIDVSQAGGAATVAAAAKGAEVVILGAVFDRLVSVHAVPQIKDKRPEGQDYSHGQRWRQQLFCCAIAAL